MILSASFDAIEGMQDQLHPGSAQILPRILVVDNLNKGEASAHEK
jgi:hypothetical protein